MYYEGVFIYSSILFDNLLYLKKNNILLLLP